jgi:ABC-2 type transport system ATP-binding protein
MTSSTDALALSGIAAAAGTAPLPDFAIEISGLTKIYRSSNGSAPVQALHGIDLKIPRGSMFALLGPNGAGKSTTIGILAGLVRKSAGTVRVWQHDIDQAPRAARAAIGIVPQEVVMDPFFTPREALELQAGYYGVPKSERRTDEILTALGLKDKADSHMRALSGGMRRRMMVGKAMVHSPPILVLDEPTAGVDVELRQQLWAYVKRLNQQGCTILLTTHYLEEAESLCDRVAIIDRGRVVANDTTASLLRQLDSKSVTLTTSGDPDPLPPSLTALGIVRTGPAALKFAYRPSLTAMGPLLNAIEAAGYPIVDLSTEEASLQDLFLKLTGHPEDHTGPS